MVNVKTTNASAIRLKDGEALYVKCQDVQEVEGKTALVMERATVLNTNVFVIQVNGYYVI